MASKLYVGNLSFSTNDDHLRDLFASLGEVVSATVVTDRETGRARGFGFVEMASETDAQKAVEALDGRDFMGRTIRVNPAQPRERSGGGGGGGGWNRDRR
jgi:RNA recognition motif-containing protein